VHGTPMAAKTQTSAEIFAANRATGGVTLATGLAENRTHCTRVHEHGSLRVRFPKSAGDLLEAVLINSAGGMAGGDTFAVKFGLGTGTSLLAGTAAAEKIYRSTGSDASITLSIDAAAGSRCLWLPQETILFDRAKLSRRIDVNLADNASLIMVEAVVFGRSAMGESVQEGRLIDRWRVRRGQRLVFAETVRLDGAIGSKLARPAVAAGGVAVASVLVVPGGEDTVAAVRALSGQFDGELGISCWNGITLARLCARDGATLRHDLTGLLAALSVPLPRLWLQ
jgi:urease accessory protein